MITETGQQTWVFKKKTPVIYRVASNQKHLISFEAANQHLVVSCFRVSGKTVSIWKPFCHALNFSPLSNSLIFTNLNIPYEIKSVVLLVRSQGILGVMLHMFMELFWVLILSELFPEDSKIEDSLRISSCVNNSVGTGLFWISLMCSYSCVQVLLPTGCGTPAQLLDPVSFVSSYDLCFLHLSSKFVRAGTASSPLYSIIFKGGPNFVTGTTTCN